MGWRFDYLKRFRIVSHVRSKEELLALIADVPRGDEVEIVSHRFVRGLEVWVNLEYGKRWEHPACDALQKLATNRPRSVFIEELTEDPEYHGPGGRRWCSQYRTVQEYWDALDDYHEECGMDEMVRQIAAFKARKAATNA